MTTLEMFDEIARRGGAGEGTALCVITAVRGSTPQVAGAKMLVPGNGRTMGTLGGGWAEDEVRTAALQLLASGPPSKRITLELDRHHCGDDAMSCGGTLEVCITAIRTPADAEPFARIAADVRADRPAEFAVPEANYRERVAPPPMLVLAGGGHVAQAVSALASKLDFRIAVIDDRPDFASEARFPAARWRITGQVDEELSRLPIDGETFVVIATRGHDRDAAALAAVVSSAAKYVGMIGSTKKVRAIVQMLRDSGVAPAKIERVRAPIGLDLGAVSVEEIAISIVAEMIAARRGVSPPIEAMKLNET